MVSSIVMRKHSDEHTSIEINVAHLELEWLEEVVSCGTTKQKR